VVSVMVFVVCASAFVSFVVAVVGSVFKATA
jgi:hypothetical protein